MTFFKKKEDTKLKELYDNKEMMAKQIGLTNSHATRTKLLRWVGRLEAKIIKQKAG